MKKRSVIGLALSLVLINLCFVSAGIYFSDLESRYNLGDTIELSIDVDPIVEGRMLEVDLVCEDSGIIVFNNLPDEMGNVVIKLPLNQYTIEDISGSCYFSGSYATSERESMSFEISTRLRVRLTSDSFFTKPGEEILISGTAERLNGLPIDGEVEIEIPLLSYLEINSEGVANFSDLLGSFDVNETHVNDTDVNETDLNETLENEETLDFSAGKYYGKVTDGDFSVSLKLGEDTPAGDYRIDVIVYEEAFGERASEGTTFSNLKVFQELREINIVLNDLNFDPGSTVEFQALLLDQTGILIDDKVTVIIKDENLNRLFEKIVDSDETISYELLSNMSSGYYEIEASSGDLVHVKNIFVNEKAIAEFQLNNDTVFVTNIGNIPYQKDIEIELNGKPFVKKTELEMGESKSFILTGEGEEYEIKVSDGESEISQGGITLTGRAVSVDSVREGGIMVFSSPIIWAFFILILGVGILFLLRNILKKKSFAIHSNKKDSKIVDLGEKKDVKPTTTVSTNVAKKEVDVSKKQDKKVSSHPSEADQVLVLKGHKTNAAVLVLKVKNKIGKIEKTSLEKAIEHAYSKKGAIYEQGDFIFIVFSPLMTHTTKNEVEAVKAAEGIISTLHNHNKRFMNKIDFGIGINTGEIINKVEEKKLKFTALGNFIVVAKRLSEASNRQILITGKAYNKGSNEIKGEKRSVAGGEVYEVRRVIDTENNKKFISGFMNRMKKDNSKNNNHVGK
jgi:hypothetical protein